MKKQRKLSWHDTLVFPLPGSLLNRMMDVWKDTTRKLMQDIILTTLADGTSRIQVCTPADAIRTFYATGLDILVLGNCVLRK